MKVFFRVTEDDILFGNPGSPHSCPIALCLKRNLSGCTVRVEADSIQIGTDVLPNPAKQFVYDYDTNQVVKPFSLCLDI
jgi:hypothetical protein